MGVGKSVGVEGGVNAVVRHCYDNSDPVLSLRTLLPISPLQQVQQRLLTVAPEARPQSDLSVEGREEVLLQQRGEQPNAWEVRGCAGEKVWEGAEGMLLQQRGEQPYAWKMGGSAARKVRAAGRGYTARSLCGAA